MAAGRRCGSFAADNRPGRCLTGRARAIASRPDLKCEPVGPVAQGFAASSSPVTRRRSTDGKTEMNALRSHEAAFSQPATQMVQTRPSPPVAARHSCVSVRFGRCRGHRSLRPRTEKNTLPGDRAARPTKRGFGYEVSGAYHAAARPSHCRSACDVRTISRVLFRTTSPLNRRCRGRTHRHGAWRKPGLARAAPEHGAIHRKICRTHQSVLPV